MKASTRQHVRPLRRPSPVSERAKTRRLLREFFGGPLAKPWSGAIWLEPDELTIDRHRCALENARNLRIKESEKAPGEFVPVSEARQHIEEMIRESARAAVPIQFLDLDRDRDQETGGDFLAWLIAGLIIAVLVAAALSALLSA